MSSVSEYLDRYGSVSLSASLLNEVDSYIISKIGAPDLSGIVPPDGEFVPLAGAVSRYAELYGDAGNYLGLLASPQIVPVIRRLPDTLRYGSLRLSGFVKKADREKTEQFSALTVTLPDGRHFVTFRGTDDSLTGWKENMLMGVQKEVWAQKDAAEYLRGAAARLDGQLIVGGHSKGGNLAVYAAARAEPAIRARICAVYNFDGPGFQPDFLKDEGYLDIRAKVHTLLPQYSIVGTLLTQDSGFDIVKSSRSGAAAHDGFNWETDGAAFVRCAALSRGSLTFEEVMADALAKTDVRRRRACINEFFGALEAAGVQTLTDLTDSRLRRSLIFLFSMRRAGASRKFAAEILESLLMEKLFPSR